MLLEAARLGLDQRTALGWIAGLGAGSLVLALSAKTMQDVGTNSRAASSSLWRRTGSALYRGPGLADRRVAGGDGRGRAGGRHREQEAKGYLDHLLARPVSRLSWLAGRVVVAAAVLVAAGLVIGLLTWVGATNVGADVRLATLLAAGVNVIPAGILVLGVGMLVHGLAPSLGRARGLRPGGLVVLGRGLGASLGLGRWLLDTSLLHHLTRPPAAQVRWDSAALVAFGLAAAAVGAVAFARRDLQGA